MPASFYLHQVLTKCVQALVDSLCRDGTDTPYSVIQTEASKNQVIKEYKP